MGVEIGLLFLILLSKAQRLFQSPAQGASASQKAAADAAAAAAAAAAAGDHATAAQKAKEAEAHATAAAQQQKAAKAPPPWPQVVPAGLPPFPSGAWHPANPVTSAMVSRAFQLLPQLWASGAGTFKTEKTGDRWVVYQAAPTLAPDGSTRNGVVAFTTWQSSSSAPAVARPQVTPGSPLPTDAETLPASTSTHRYPTLRRGSSGPSVVWLQQQLHIPADGSFGPGTERAVKAFQAQHGLDPDGVVGTSTWNALHGSAQAA